MEFSTFFYFQTLILSTNDFMNCFNPFNLSLDINIDQIENIIYLLDCLLLFPI